MDFCSRGFMLFLLRRFVPVLQLLFCNFQVFLSTIAFFEPDIQFIPLITCSRADPGLILCKVAMVFLEGFEQLGFCRFIMELGFTKMITLYKGLIHQHSMLLAVHPFYIMENY